MSSAKRQNEASGASSFSNVFLLLFITFHCSVSVTTEKSSGSKDDSIRLLLSDNGRRGGTADWPTIRLMRLRSVSQPPVTLQTVSPEFQAEVYVTSSSFAYSYWEKTLFFVDQDDNIRFTKIEANEEKKLVTNMVHERVLDETVSSLSVDWVTNKIFWFISTSPARLEVSDFEGNIWRVLLSDDPDVEMVTGMAVDPHQGYVYFLNGGHKRLDRVWMDGSHLSTLLHLSSKDGQASSRLPATLLRLDMSSGLLYWVERGRIVRRCNSSNGENLETVFSGHADLRQIDIYEGYLYMLTFGDRIGNRKLYRKCISADPNICPVPSDNDTATELLERQQAEDFMIFEPEIQPQRRSIDGVWHTGICAYGSEYFFGGDGVTYCPPNGTILGPPTEVIDLGMTEIPFDLFQEYLIELANGRFSGNKYHLLDHNCNTFSNELAQFLTGRPIPEKITNLPGDVMTTPFGQMIRPFVDSMMGQIGGGGQTHVGNRSQANDAAASNASSTPTNPPPNRDRSSDQPKESKPKCGEDLLDLD